MSKRRRHKYLEVDYLPEGAMKVSEYADKRDCNTSYIYKLAKMKRENIPTEQDTSFEIVVFHGINFIIPQ